MEGDADTDMSPAGRGVSPDLDILRRNIMIDFNIGEESETTTVVPKRHVCDNQPDSEKFPAECPLGLRGKLEHPCSDTGDTLTVVKDNLIEFEKAHIHIKKESENVVLNALPFYTNRIILGKINADDEECENDAPSGSDVVDTAHADKRGETSNQYHEMERCLLAIVIVTDCYKALLDSECYCARCAVLFPSSDQHRQHRTSTHTETTNVTVEELDSAVTSDSNNIQDKGLANKVPDLDMRRNLEDSRSKQYNDMERCLPVRVVLTDCYQSLLDDECYCAPCAVLFPHCDARREHAASAHAGRRTHERIRTHPATTPAPEALAAAVTFLQQQQQLLSSKIQMKTHNGLKLYESETCKKIFSQKARLIQHQLIHTDNKKNHDNHLNRQFIRKIHKGINPFVCKICHKKFRKKAQLNQHELIHTREKPYECETCKKRFEQKYQLEKHMYFHKVDKMFYENQLNKNIIQIIHKDENPFEC